MDSNRNDLLWKALGDSTRRTILDQLHQGARTTGDLCAAFPELDRCTVMKHLEVLVSANLVLTRREGRERINTLNPGPLLEIVARWVGRFEAQWMERADRIGQLVEGKSKKQLSGK